MRGIQGYGLDEDVFSSRVGGGCPPRVPLASRAILSRCRRAAWRMTIPPNGTEASEQRFCGGGDAPSAEPASNVSRIATCKTNLARSRGTCRVKARCIGRVCWMFLWPR